MAKNLVPNPQQNNTRSNHHTEQEHAMQELIDRHHVTTNNGWTITVTREDDDDTVRGYIVTAHDDSRITTLFTVPVGNTWTQSTAFAIALNYTRHAVNGIEQFGHLPNYAPRHASFYRN